ncbi:MAG: ABC transporter ATP-binding protein [Pseudomonadota bacterium]
MRIPVLLTDLYTWSRGRLALPLALSLAGAVIEGVSLIMLLPLLSLILGAAAEGTPDGTTSQVTAALADWLPADPTQALTLVLAGFAAVLAARFGIIVWRESVLAQLEQSFIADMRLRLFGAIAGASWAEARTLGHGQIGHALSRDIDRSASAVRAVLSGGSAAVLLIVQAGLAFWLAPFVALMVASLGLIVFLTIGPIRARTTRISRQITQEDFRLFTSVSGFLRGLKSAKAHGMTDGYITSFAQASRGFGGRLVALRQNASLASAALQGAAALLALVSVYIGHVWIAIAPEVLIVILILMVRIAPLLQAIQSAMQSVRAGSVAYGAARRAVLDGLRSDTSIATPSAPSVAAAVAPWQHPPEFQLTGVGRVGDGAVTLLNGITATVPRGQVTAISGPSGAGKSTLLDVIVGLDPPDSGQILIDGQSFDASARAALAQALAYVGQDDTLLEPTLRANLILGLGEVAEDLIWQALQTVGAADMVRGAEGGLDGPLRMDAQRFSGGERQRLRLARALLRAPKLLVLDEATSALDPTAEAAVLDAVRAALPEATVLMVSHRAETAARADHVIRLDGGRLA